MKKTEEPYPHAGEGDDERADAVWKKKKNWTKLWRKVSNELSNTNNRSSQKHERAR